MVAGGLALRILTPTFLVLTPTSFYLADPSSAAAGQQLKCLQNQTGAVNRDQIGDNSEWWGVWEPDPQTETAAVQLQLTA